MSTHFDKYISNQVQNIEDNLQVGNWSDFQSRYARYRRIKAMRIILPSVAAVSVLSVFMLPGINGVDDEMKYTAEPIALRADSTPAIKMEIPACTELPNLVRRQQETDPMVPDSVYNDIPAQHTEAIVARKNESTEQAYHPYSSFDAFEKEVPPEDRPKRRMPGFSIGVAGGPGVVSREGSFIQFNGPDGIMAGNREEVSYIHMPPVTMGISVGVHLNGRLTFITGLDYSIYSSHKEIVSSGNMRHEMQRLHYLGLPIRLDCSIYSSKSFEWYVGGGIQVEKCIYGKSGTAILTENNLLWSAVVTTGIQYNFTNSLSLYFEPYCSYLFSDTALFSYRSDNPVGISASLGLRIKLSNRE